MKNKIQIVLAIVVLLFCLYPWKKTSARYDVITKSSNCTEREKLETKVNVTHDPCQIYLCANCVENETKKEVLKDNRPLAANRKNGQSFSNTTDSIVGNFLYNRIATYVKHCCALQRAVLTVLRKLQSSLIFCVCVVQFLNKVHKGKAFLDRRHRETHIYKTNIKHFRSRRKNYKTSLPNFLFDIRHFGWGRFDIVLLPFSINQYANDIVKEHRAGEELMKYEWARYLSFKTFPMTSVMTPLRLAQAGFFYTERGEEVKCFCCGITNDRWTSEETAFQTHRRLSPRCKFVLAEETDNVAIHYPEYYEHDFSGRPFAPQASSSRFESGASGGPADVQRETSPNTSRRTQNTADPVSNTPTTQSRSGSETRNDREVENRETHWETPKVKHPEYSQIDVRLQSFSTWDLDAIQEPRTLATEGFFYTGVRDFVRCFFCGIGLKNWERTDNPSTEHAHWSKNCGFLLQRKNAPSTQTKQNEEPRSQNTLPERNSSITSAHAGQSTTNSNTTESEQQEDDVKAAVMASLIDMGYSESDIDKAIEAYRRSNENGSFSVDSMLEALRESSATGSTSLPNSESSLTSTAAADEPSSAKGGAKKSGTAKPKMSTTGATRSALTEEAKSLQEENRTLKDQILCKICFDRDANVVFLPCGHMVSCRQCAQSLRKCAVCRKLIRGTVHVYPG